MKSTIVAICCLLVSVACTNSVESGDRQVLSSQADSLLELAEQYYDQSRYGDAIQCASAAARLYEEVGDSAGLSDCYSNIGSNYQRMGDVSKGIEMMLKCLSLDSLQNDVERLSSDYSNLAALYLTIHDADRAEAFIERAIDLERLQPESSSLSIRYGIATEIHTAQGKYDDALAYGWMAYRLDSLAADTVKMARRMSQLADAYQAKGDYASAERLYNTSNYYLRQKNSLHSLCINYKQLGRLYDTLHRDEEAISSITASAAIARQIGNKYILQQDEEALAELYSDTQPSLAYSHLRASQDLKDSLYSDRTNLLYTQFAVQYDMSGKDETIQQQQRTIHFHHLSHTIAIMLLALVLLVIATLWRIRQLNRQKQTLQQKYVLALTQEPFDDEAASDIVKPETERDRAFLLKVNESIQRNMDRSNLSSTTIAADVCLGQRQLNRRVKAVTGLDTTSYIRSKRILHAQHLLTHTDQPISCIYVECGFDSPSYFSRIFKQETGLTPTEYRNQRAEQVERSKG